MKQLKSYSHSQTFLLCIFLNTRNKYFIVNAKSEFSTQKCKTVFYQGCVNKGLAILPLLKVSCIYPVQLTLRVKNWTEV